MSPTRRARRIRLAWTVASLLFAAAAVAALVLSITSAVNRADSAARQAAAARQRAEVTRAYAVTIRSALVAACKSANVGRHANVFVLEYLHRHDGTSLTLGWLLRDARKAANKLNGCARRYPEPPVAR